MANFFIFELIKKSLCIFIEYGVREREIKFIGLFEDIGVHIIHISRLIITYTLE